MKVLLGENVTERVVYYVHCVVRYIRRIHCSKSLLGFFGSVRFVICLTAVLKVAGLKNELEMA